AGEGVGRRRRRAVDIGALEVGFDADQPGRRDLPVVAGLRAAKKSAGAQGRRAGGGAEAERRHAADRERILKPVAAEAAVEADVNAGPARRGGGGGGGGGRRGEMGGASRRRPERERRERDQQIRNAWHDRPPPLGIGPSEHRSRSVKTG